MVGERHVLLNLPFEETVSALPTRPQAAVSRDDLALRYIEQLPFAPYPVQEQALYAWFESHEGVLVAAPTGMGKTLIAEAAAFEALTTGTTIYYTTPLIALTEQKFQEWQALARRWGFSPDDVGLVTGNRRVNPQAKVLVVVAEILLNRLLQPQAFDFASVSAVVMDEFHSFSDPERGIVWEFTLSLLPPHVRLLLLSATVGNSREFLDWLHRCHGRRLELVQSTERKVPLRYQWTPDLLLNELLEQMAAGEADARKTPALVFCFNRDECWAVADELKGRSMLAEGQQKQLVDRLAKHDWTKGAGPRLKQVLQRGVGVHHAGLLPRYRRVVEEFFQKKLLTVCVCTETLSAGINLPARSVVLPTLLKGPPGKQKLIDPSVAHQIFGRAGRPQFDTQGFVMALPHEDDVKILRWKEKYDQIPENTKDPGLMQAKKALKRKMPVRSPNRQYWNEAQFARLQSAPPRSLASQGPLPWRMLAYMLQLSPDVERLRQLVRKRLTEPERLQQGERQLHGMLLSLHAAQVVRLEPEPPVVDEAGSAAPARAEAPAAPKLSPMARLIVEALAQERKARGEAPLPAVVGAEAAPARSDYRPVAAHPTPRINDFFVFRSLNPLYALFLLDHFALADQNEVLQILDSALELPRSLLRHVRVPRPDQLPPGPLARERVDAALVQRGLIAAADLYPEWDPDARPEDRKYAPPLAEKMRMLFESEYPGVHGVSVYPAWVTADVLQFAGDFHKFIAGRDLAKQEGLIFRHLLRMILLLGEFATVTPSGVAATDWRERVDAIARQLTECCRAVDPSSTDYTLTHVGDRDLISQEPVAASATSTEIAAEAVEAALSDDDFASGVLEVE
ncbi:MAG: DEAD/DEAH box helicase [Planctomycetaceae bacterium]